MNTPKRKIKNLGRVSKIIHTRYENIADMLSEIIENQKISEIEIEAEIKNKAQKMQRDEGE